MVKEISESEIMTESGPALAWPAWLALSSGPVGSSFYLKIQYIAHHRILYINFCPFKYCIKIAFILISFWRPLEFCTRGECLTGSPSPDPDAFLSNFSVILRIYVTFIIRRKGKMTILKRWIVKRRLEQEALQSAWEAKQNMWAISITKP